MAIERGDTRSDNYFPSTYNAHRPSLRHFVIPGLGSPVQILPIVLFSSIRDVVED